MYPFLFRSLSRLPLPVLHAFGWLLGWLTFVLSGRYRRKLFAHAQQAGFPRSVALASVAEAGKMVTELPRLWLGGPVHLEWEGMHLVEDAIAEVSFGRLKQGILGFINKTHFNLSLIHISEPTRPY